MDKILLIDDEETYCQKFSAVMKRQAGFQIDWICSLSDVEKTLSAHSYSLILLDLMFNGRPEGFEALQSMRKLADCPPIIVVTNSSEIPQAVKAIKLGALDFLEKNTDLERIELTIRNALDSSRITKENRELRRSIRSKYQIVGEHPAVLALIETVRKIADSDEVALITGETGTGKELVARAIHAESERVSQPFVPVNCAAIPDTLIESELFGHEKGAFTGADRKREGAFLSAGRGIIFLDEIGDMPEIAQAKILRVLEEKRIRRIGSFEEFPYQARVVVATRKDLTTIVKEGGFREDLYYRLNVLHIHVPALREHREDIRVLFEHYLALSFADAGAKVPSVDNRVLPMLMAYDWPGNIRELRNLTQKIALLHEGGPITPEDIRLHLPEIEPEATAGQSLRTARNSAERELIENALFQCDGNVKAAAARLNQSVWNVYKKMKKYGLSPAKK